MPSKAFFRIALPVLMAAQCLATSAWACLPIGDRAPNTPADNAAFARAMVRQAASIEVVEVQSETAFADPDLWRRWLERQVSMYKGPPHPTVMASFERTVAERRMAPAGTRYQLRVIRRLKGTGPDRIQMDGGFPSLAAKGIVSSGPERLPAPPLQHWVGKDANRPFVFMEPDELGPHNLIEQTSCDAAPIAFRRGTRYLMFRGSDGHLLGPVKFRGVRESRLGYRLVELEPGGPLAWLSAVEKAARELAPQSHDAGAK